jgi:hypothetical protein
MPLVSTSPVHSIGEAGRWGSFAEVLHDRGVAIVEGCVFIGGIGRGTPPSDLVRPCVVMQPEASRLTDAEESSVAIAVHQRVHSLVLDASEAEGETSDLVEARYRLGMPFGLHVVIDVHGLDHRVIRRRYG